MIVSGPASLDSMRTGWLAPYLPATSSQTHAWDADDLAALASKLPGCKPPTVMQPLPGVKLEVAPEAEVVCAAEAGEPLLVERRIGRGRIIVSAFRLNQRELVQWQDYDHLINHLLLRRRERKYRPNDRIPIAWVPKAMAELRAASNGRYVPWFNTEVRYFTRDASPRPPHVASLRQDEMFRDWSETTTSAEELEMVGIPSGPGAAAWNDDSRASALAHNALRESAGIIVPPANLVAQLLVAYLIVLVPVNWLVFRLLRRVEWAWAVAPVIAVSFAFLVVRVAELDIGFARARTEVAVVEAMAGYPRAHCTRYVALYNSIGTSYRAENTDPGGVVLPFSPLDSGRTGSSGSSVTLNRVANETAAEVLRLERFVVGSNTTSMLHAEAMLDLGGGIEARSDAPDLWTVINRTGHTWHGAHVWSHGKVGWIGELSPGEETTVYLTEDDQFLETLKASLRPHDDTSTTQIPLFPLLQLARDAMHYGDVRLIAFSREPLEGFTVQPAAAQWRAANVLLVHVKPSPLPPLPVARASQ